MSGRLRVMALLIPEFPGQTHVAMGRLGQAACLRPGRVAGAARAWRRHNPSLSGEPLAAALEAAAVDRSRRSVPAAGRYSLSSILI